VPNAARGGARLSFSGTNPAAEASLSLRIVVFRQNTRMHVRLLGPCFKTGPCCLVVAEHSLWTGRREAKGLLPLQFQALFNSFFKVLFKFPSRYLFAIGLSRIFSLRWNLPPDSCYNIVQHYSTRRGWQRALKLTGLSPSLASISTKLAFRVHHAPRLSGHIGHCCPSKPGRFPFRSPLLRESSLVSFPPLSNMLKFSGSSCFT